MKAIALDTASTCISIAAKNGDMNARVTLDIGMHQSEKLVPTIAYVMEQCSLKPEDIEFTAICRGPGSFTGLRLGFAALKALEFSTHCKTYGVPSLDVYAYPFASWKGFVLSVIDAKKDRFYFSVYQNGNLVTGPKDVLPEEIDSLLSEIITKEATVNANNTSKIPFLVVGPDARYFKSIMNEQFPKLDLTLFDFGLSCMPSSTDALFEIANTSFTNNDKSLAPLAEYEGPLYIRKSEAEIKASGKVI